jgi:hypothetical protein
MEPALPDGWTLERLREVSQSPVVEVLPNTVPVFLETFPHGNNTDLVRTPLEPELIISFRYMILLRVVGEPEWYMGEQHGDEVIAWGSYGPDLGGAIRAM